MGLVVGVAEGGTWGYGIHAIGFLAPGGTCGGASGGPRRDPGNRRSDQVCWSRGLQSIRLLTA